MNKRVFDVYVDEVFEHFMNLPRMEGYFGYVLLMLNEKANHDLERFWAALEGRLKRYYEAATNFKIEGEFKSTYLGKLPTEDRYDIAKRIAYFLTKNRGFIGTFYTTVHAVLCWELRSSAGFQRADI